MMVSWASGLFISIVLGLLGWWLVLAIPYWWNKLRKPEPLIEFSVEDEQWLAENGITLPKSEIYERN